MVTEAIAKLRTEIDQNKNNPYVQVVGEFLINHINSNPASAEKIINTDKTIAKSLDEMKKEAQKKKVGNCAVLTDQEGFEIVLKYFEIDTKAGQAVTETLNNVTKEPKNVTETVEFDIKLEDLI